MTVVPLEYIEVDDRGVAKLIGSRIKVIHLVMEQLGHGWSPEQIQSQHEHLSLAQVYAALAYYHAHQPEIDAQIVEYHRYSGEMRAKHPNTLTREVLEARWRALYPDRPPPTLAEVEADIADLV